jgi:hypothetical protein
MIPKSRMAPTRSIKYIAGLIDDIVVKGIPEKRIMLGRFSQRDVVSPLTSLSSKVLGQLAGLMMLSPITGPHHLAMFV